MLQRIAIVLLLTMLATPLHAQDDDPLGGASRPNPQMVLKRGGRQYKRNHQFALRLILLDRLEEAEELLQDFLSDDPGDPESHYMLGLLYAQQEKTEQAINELRRAVVLGLPPGRVLAGPRELISELQENAFFDVLRKSLAGKPLHGPLVGNVTDHSAAFWVRTAEAEKVIVTLREQADKAAPLHSAGTLSKADDDFTAVVNVDGLKANTVYSYEVTVGNHPTELTDDSPQFQTFPAPGEASEFRIAFGGGAGFVPPHERMWDTIASYHPLALLLLGDNTYIDDPESVEMQQYTYQRRQSRPEYRRLTGRTAVFTIWDDHDFGTNDCWGGPLVDKPAWKRDKAWKVYKQNWPNPGFGGGPEQPGCYYAFSIGDIDFIMLDCRYYRTTAKIDNPSMLGPVQLKWFEEELLKCHGKFKVICSSVPWDFRTKGDSLDTWNGYKEEREKIFRLIEDNNIPGVVLMSADRHRSDAWKIERAGGYPFYEFNSSRLTNQHVHPTMEKAGAIFSYNAKQSFGLVTFDTTLDDPTVRYEVINIDGERIDGLTVKLSELR